MFIYLIGSHHTYAISSYITQIVCMLVCLYKSLTMTSSCYLAFVCVSIYLHFPIQCQARSVQYLNTLEAIWQRHYQQQQQRQHWHQHKKEWILFFFIQALLRCAFDDVSRFSTSRAFSNEWVLTDCKSRRLDLSFGTVCVCVFFSSFLFF